MRGCALIFVESSRQRFQSRSTLQLCLCHGRGQRPVALAGCIFLRAYAMHLEQIAEIKDRSCAVVLEYNISFSSRPPVLSYAHPHLPQPCKLLHSTRHRLDLRHIPSPLYTCRHHIRFQFYLDQAVDTPTILRDQFNPAPPSCSTTVETYIRLPRISQTAFVSKPTESPPRIHCPLYGKKWSAAGM